MLFRSGGAALTPPASTESASSSAPQQTTTDARPQIPSLIPLYDFATAPPPQTQALHYLQQQQLNQRYAFRGPAPPQPQGFRTQGQSTATHPRYRQPASQRVPLAQLPPTLTDEQLGRLDRLTRDAIDERLRVLEGVSNAVYRCVEELTRIRSALPVREEAGLAVQPQATATPAASSSEQQATGADAHADAAAPAGETLLKQGQPSSEPQGEHFAGVPGGSSEGQRTSSDAPEPPLL